MVNVLNVPLHDTEITDSVNQVMALCTSSDALKQNRCISATGAHGLVIAQRDPSFKKILNEFYLNLPDGMPGVWIGRLKGSKKMKRCYGPDFFKETFIKTNSLPIKHFFCGGKEGVAEELKIAVAKKFNNHQVAGTFCPPFREMSEVEMQSLGNLINECKTDIVWIGLSTPKQEIFATRLKNFVGVHFIITVGAAFDFHTDRLKQAPAWMQRMGLEWLYRLLREPKRLYKRYFDIVPSFIYYNLKEFVHFCFSKK